MKIELKMWECWMLVIIGFGLGIGFSTVVMSFDRIDEISKDLKQIERNSVFYSGRYTNCQWVSKLSNENQNKEWKAYTWLVTGGYGLCK